MSRIVGMLVLMVIVCGVSQPGWSDLFQYTDRDGTIVIVDDESKVPAKYRKNHRPVAPPVAAPNGIPV